MILHSPMTFIAIFFISACMSAPKPPMVATETSPSTAAPEAPPSTVQPRAARIELKTQTDQRLATIHLKEIPEGLLVLLETYELVNGSYQVAISEECSTTSKGNNASFKVIRKFGIQKSSLSDEFKLEGFTLNQEGLYNIQGMALNLVSISQKSKPVILACSRIQ